MVSRTSKGVDEAEYLRGGAGGCSSPGWQPDRNLAPAGIATSRCPSCARDPAASESLGRCGFGSECSFASHPVAALLSRSWNSARIRGSDPFRAPFRCRFTIPSSTSSSSRLFYSRSVCIFRPRSVYVGSRCLHSVNYLISSEQTSFDP
jgi:hypothetical protein